MTTQRIAELEAEVLRLREALEHLSKAAGQTIDVRTPEDWVNLNIGLSLSIQVLSAPFTPTALPELIEKVEKMTIERCAKAVWNSKPSQKAIDEIPAAYQLASLAAIRAIPTGHIKLEELL